MSLNKIVFETYNVDSTKEYNKGLFSGLTVGTIIGSFLTLMIILG